MSAQVILCYHKVGPIAQNGKRLNVEATRLSQNVAFFSRKGPILLARELAQKWPPRFTCFTFDDAYESTLKYAVPVLESANVRGSFYAVSALVGKSSEWDGGLASPLADWRTLLAAQNAGHEIGNHSATHPAFANLSPADQEIELWRCDKELRENQIEPKSFCFPYGSYNGSTLDAMNALGYSVGLALRKQPTNPNEDRRALSRIVVGYSDSVIMLLYKIYVRPKLKGMR